MVQKDVELASSIRETAKTELRRREWASRRGKATRTFLREHSELITEFMETGSIMATSFPKYVTRASVLLELRMRASRREAAKAVKDWRESHPEEAKRLEEEVRREAAAVEVRSG